MGKNSHRLLDDLLAPPPPPPSSTGRSQALMSLLLQNGGDVEGGRGEDEEHRAGSEVTPLRKTEAAKGETTSSSSLFAPLGGGGGGKEAADDAGDCGGDDEGSRGTASWGEESFEGRPREEGGQQPPAENSGGDDRRGAKGASAVAAVVDDDEEDNETVSSNAISEEIDAAVAKAEEELRREEEEEAEKEREEGNDDDGNDGYDDELEGFADAEQYLPRGVGGTTSPSQLGCIVLDRRGRKRASSRGGGNGGGGGGGGDDCNNGGTTTMRRPSSSSDHSPPASTCSASSILAEQIQGQLHDAHRALLAVRENASMERHELECDNDALAGTIDRLNDEIVAKKLELMNALNERDEARRELKSVLGEEAADAHGELTAERDRMRVRIGELLMENENMKDELSEMRLRMKDCTCLISGFGRRPRGRAGQGGGSAAAALQQGAGRPPRPLGKIGSMSLRNLSKMSDEAMKDPPPAGAAVVRGRLASARHLGHLPGGSSSRSFDGQLRRQPRGVGRGSGASLDRRLEYNHGGDGDGDGGRRLRTASAASSNDDDDEEGTDRLSSLRDMSKISPISEWGGDDELDDGEYRTAGQLLQDWEVPVLDNDDGDASAPSPQSKKPPPAETRRKDESNEGDRRALFGRMKFGRDQDRTLDDDAGNVQSSKGGEGTAEVSSSSAAPPSASRRSPPHRAGPFSSLRNLSQRLQVGAGVGGTDGGGDDGEGGAARAATPGRAPTPAPTAVPAARRRASANDASRRPRAAAGRSFRNLGDERVRFDDGGTAPSAAGTPSEPSSSSGDKNGAGTGGGSLARRVHAAANAREHARRSQRNLAMEAARLRSRERSLRAFNEAADAKAEGGGVGGGGGGGEAKAKKERDREEGGEGEELERIEAQARREALPAMVVGA